MTAKVAVQTGKASCVEEKAVIFLNVPVTIPAYAKSGHVCLMGVSNRGETR